MARFRLAALALCAYGLAVVMPGACAASASGPILSPDDHHGWNRMRIHIPGHWMRDDNEAHV